MAGEWRETALGEVTDVLSGGTPSKDRADYWAGSVPWVSAKDMKRFRLEDTEDHVSEEGIGNGTRLVPARSVLLLVRGMTLLNDLPICVISRPMTFNQDVKALRPKPQVRTDYLPYLLLGNKERLLSLVDLAGHGTGRLNSDELKALDVVLPPPNEQRAIAHILGTLDDKIELNRRMNETLEAMARALFKSWFVDFEPVRAKAEGRDPGLPPALAGLFPSEFEDSELGEIPKGWRVSMIGEVATLDKGVSYKGEFLTDDGIPMVNLGCFGGNGRFIAEKLKPYGGEHRDRHLVAPGDIVIANTDMTQNRIILGSPAIVPKVPGHDQVLFSHHVFALRLAHGWWPHREFLFQQFLRPEFRERAEGFATGTTVLALPRDAILALPFVVPPAQVLGAFEALANPSRARAAWLVQESGMLTELRDTLLPKLISGELRVPDAERLLEAAR